VVRSISAMRRSATIAHGRRQRPSFGIADPLRTRKPRKRGPATRTMPDVPGQIALFQASYLN